MLGHEPEPLTTGELTVSSTKTKDVRAAAEAELGFDPLVGSADITVVNVGGNVSLTGTVLSYQQYLEAAAAARRVAGVATVDNNLEVVLPESDFRDDAKLTTAANNVLAANVTVPDSVQATTHDGNITLTGAVSYGTERAAVETAVSGLISVRNVRNDIDISYVIDPVHVDLHVQQALDRSALVPDGSDVKADTQDGVITLTGHVRTWAEHDAVSTLDFPPGAVLCLYTDGLVERRDQPIDQGIARLRAAVTTADPEAGCAAVMAAMAGYTPHTDDIALLMLRHPLGEPGGSGPDSSPPADTRTALDRGVRWSGRHAVVTMPAEMDITNASGVSDLLAAVAGESAEVITADMTATVFCDSAGVQALARACEQAAASGSELRLALGGSPTARIVQLIGLDQIVPVYRDVQQSLATPRQRA